MLQVCCNIVTYIYALAILVLEKLFRFMVAIVYIIVPESWIRKCSHHRLILSFFGTNTIEETVPRSSMDACELMYAAGYGSETHFTATSDGFMLCLHRLCPRESVGSNDSSLNSPCKQTNNYTSTNESRSRAPSSQKMKQRPVVFLMHGFMMSSECFLCLPHSLAYILCDAGYDVWLGNTRGNKYSAKHLKHDVSQPEFWNFCLDDIATYDLPASIDFILDYTKQEKLAYIGFSQGTAVAFAAFSMNIELSNKIACYCALAATCKPKGFHSSLIDSLAKSTSDVIYSLLGHKSVLPSTLFWQHTLHEKMYVYSIDKAIKILFGWDAKNISYQNKRDAYYHLYSFSSVKIIVHWFQLMQSGGFHMYEENKSDFIGDVSGVDQKHHDWGGYVHYPINHISCPTFAFVGESDFLPDNAWLEENVSNNAQIFAIPTFEHLDFIFSSDAAVHVYPKIITILSTLHGSSRAIRTPPSVSV